MQRITPGALVAIALLVAATLAAQTPTEVNPLLFTVNGEKVFAADVSMMMRSIQGHFQQRGQNPPNDQLMRLATQRIVEQKLFAQEARRLGLEPDEKRLSQALETMVSQAGGSATLESSLAQGGITYQRFVDNLREGDLAQVFVDTQIIPGITVSDEEMQQYYQAHPETFEVPDQVRARHILINVEETADETAVAAAKKRAEDARARVLSGDEFAKVAMEVSECPSSGNGGDLGVFTANRMVEEFSAAAFALEPGEISEVVRTQFGFHVIKVEEKRPAGVTSFEEAVPGLKQALTMSKVDGVIRAKVEELRAAATIESLHEGLQAPLVGGAPAGQPATTPDSAGSE